VSDKFNSLIEANPGRIENSCVGRESESAVCTHSISSIAFEYIVLQLFDIDIVSFILMLNESATDSLFE
jgi:hypothetical protein